MNGPLVHEEDNVYRLEEDDTVWIDTGSITVRIIRSEGSVIVDTFVRQHEDNARGRLNGLVSTPIDVANALSAIADVEAASARLATAQKAGTTLGTMPIGQLMDLRRACMQPSQDDDEDDEEDEDEDDDAV